MKANGWQAEYGELFIFYRNLLNSDMSKSKYTHLNHNLTLEFTSFDA